MWRTTQVIISNFSLTFPYLWVGGENPWCSWWVELYRLALSPGNALFVQIVFRSIFMKIFEPEPQELLRLVWHYTAKNLYRKFETNIHSPNFHIHVSVSDLYIPTIDLPILLHEICGPILRIYKSLTDTEIWKLGLRPRNSQKRNT